MAKKHGYMIHFTTEERAAVRKAALHAGVHMSTFVRHIVRKAVGMPTLGDEAEVQP